MNAALAPCQAYSSSITQDILRGWKIWTLPRLAPVKNKQLVVSDTVPRYRYSGYSVSKVNSSNQIEHMGRDKLKKPTRFKLRNSVKNLVWANSGNGGYSDKTQVKYSSKDLLVFLLHTDTGIKPFHAFENQRHELNILWEKIKICGECSFEEVSTHPMS